MSRHCASPARSSAPWLVSRRPSSVDVSPAKSIRMFEGFMTRGTAPSETLASVSAMPPLRSGLSSVPESATSTLSLPSTFSSEPIRVLTIDRSPPLKRMRPSSLRVLAGSITATVALRSALSRIFTSSSAEARDLSVRALRLTVSRCTTRGSSPVVCVTVMPSASTSASISGRLPEERSHFALAVPLTVPATVVSGGSQGLRTSSSHLRSLRVAEPFSPARSLSSMQTSPGLPTQQ